MLSNGCYAIGKKIKVAKPGFNYGRVMYAS